MQPRMEPRFNPRAAQNNRFGNRQPAQARRNFAPSGGSTFAGGILSFSIDGRSNRRTFALFSVITLVLLMFSFAVLLVSALTDKAALRAKYEKEMKEAATITAQMAAAGANLITIDEYLKKHERGPYSPIGQIVSSNEDYFYSDDETSSTPSFDFEVFMFLIPTILLVVYSWIFVLGRRLHDLGLSAQWIFLIWFLTAFFTYLAGVVGWELLPLLLVVGVFCFVPGNVGMNEYGYPPERKFFP